jgi:hypothetical protein
MKIVKQSPARRTQVDQVGRLGAPEDQYEGMRRAEQRGTRARHERGRSAAFRHSYREAVGARVEVVVEAQAPPRLHCVLFRHGADNAFTCAEHNITLFAQGNAPGQSITRCI